MGILIKPIFLLGLPRRHLGIRALCRYRLHWLSGAGLNHCDSQRAKELDVPGWLSETGLYHSVSRRTREIRRSWRADRLSFIVILKNGYSWLVEDLPRAKAMRLCIGVEGMSLVYGGIPVD